MTDTRIQKKGGSFEQDQFLTILSREDALARFEAALFPRVIASEGRSLADALGQALADRYRFAHRCTAVRSLKCRWLRAAFRRSGVGGRGDPDPVCSQRRNHRVRHRAGADRLVGNGDLDCDRGTGAAWRRCYRDGRAYPARR